MVNPRHQTPQGQSVAKPGTLLQNILDGNLNMTQRSPKVTCSGRYSDGMSRGKNIQGGVHLQNQWNRIRSEVPRWLACVYCTVMCLFRMTDGHYCRHHIGCDLLLVLKQQNAKMVIYIPHSIISCLATKHNSYCQLCLYPRYCDFSLCLKNCEFRLF